MLTFDTIPSDIRAPAVLAEISGARAFGGPLVKPHKLLVIASRTSAGSVAALIPKKISSVDQGRSFFGNGSMMHNCLEKIFANDHEADITAIAVDDAGGGTAGTLGITVTSSSALAGTIALYIGGRRVLCAVAAGDTAATICANLVAAINAVDGMPVTASAASPTVTLTAKNKGVEQNQIDVRLNYNDGEALPSGVTLATLPNLIGGTVAGATNPTIGSSVWNAIGEVQYDEIICPFTDSANNTAIHAELVRRYGPLVAIDGTAFNAKIDSLANLVTFGDAQNSQHISTLGMRGALNPPWEIAAAYGAIASFNFRQDPNRTIRSLPLFGIYAPADKDNFTLLERDQLLRNGISETYAIRGTVYVDRPITQYQLSAAGAPDIAFLDLPIVKGLSYIRWDYVRRWRANYPRHKIAQDGNRFGSGQPVVTPKIARGEALAAYRDWMDLGIVKDFEGFQRDLLCEISQVDPTRINQILPVRMVGSFYELAVQFQFQL